MNAHDTERSPVPDLLFEDECEERVAALGALRDDPGSLDAAQPLDRLTVFLTYACNLDCPYCKTIARSPEELAQRPEKKITYTLAAFRSFLDAHAGTPIRHLHYTGGEAALVPDLPDMIAYARERGVARQSITTNGTRPPETYLRLIEAGLDEVRVSIDAADTALGAELTRRAGAWDASVAAIRTLAGARAGGARFFLILNTVIGAANRDRLPEILAFLLGLGPDDIKLITNVDERLAETGGPRTDGLRRACAALLAPYPAGRFPLLRRKLETVFAGGCIGLDGPRQRGDFRCYVPLTERTVDGRYYYPCSVYLREGGAPMGRVDEPPGEQRRRTAAFVSRADCLDDPICRRYCLHCTREYNLRANAARSRAS
ncbi:MAG: radical SAM protein [Planctomycetota bacterium]|nr:radical SAM protein [Planctomycetota bacterium]